MIKPKPTEDRQKRRRETKCKETKADREKEKREDRIRERWRESREHEIRRAMRCEKRNKSGRKEMIVASVQSSTVYN